MKAISKIRDHLGRHDDGQHPSDRNSKDIPTIAPDSDSVADASPNLINHGEAVEPSKAEKIKTKAKTLQHAIQHPRQAVKQRPQKKFVNQFVLTEQPWLADQSKANFELFEAYDALESAETALTEHPHNPDLKLQVQTAERLVLDLEEKREAMEVSWHLSRYVHRARVVRRDVEFPDRNDPQYFEGDGTGKKQRFLWVKWLGHVCKHNGSDLVRRCQN